jgi:pyridoxal phosphate enzyme (YggS family)
MDTIRENINRVKERIARAAFRVGRDPGEILLVAVTKSVAVEQIKEGIENGLTVLGENRIQEAEKKIGDLDGRVQWHLIGHLQTNKIKKAIELFDLIHSIDSLRLVTEIDRMASMLNRIVPVLIQVNLSGEETKSGFSREEFWSALDHLERFEYIQIRGLMTIPPWSEDPEDSRRYFKELAHLKEEVSLRDRERMTMDILSMGMSQDFEVAIEEGTTMVRIGTALFGERCKV